MIRINLLPARKSKRSDRGEKSLAVGFGVIVAAAAAVFLLVHQPLQAEIEQAQIKNQKLKKRNAELREETKDFEKLQSAFNAAEKQRATIQALQDARATPAWFLYELSNIMRPDGQPTMTPQMARRVREDPNRSWMQGWDPKNVWITSLSERRGRFKIEAGASSDSDMTQFVLRLQASVFLQDVVPQGGRDVSKGNRSHYRFTITGRAVY